MCTLTSALWRAVEGAQRRRASVRCGVLLDSNVTSGGWQFSEGNTREGFTGCCEPEKHPIRQLRFDLVEMCKGFRIWLFGRREVTTKPFAFL